MYIKNTGGRKDTWDNNQFFFWMIWTNASKARESSLSPIPNKPQVFQQAWGDGKPWKQSIEVLTALSKY